MACLRLVTFFPERPDRSVPRLRSRIAFVDLPGSFSSVLAPSFILVFLVFFVTMLDQVDPMLEFYTGKEDNPSPVLRRGVRTTSS